MSLYLFSFFTASLSLLESTGTGNSLYASNLSKLLFKLLKPLYTLSNSSMYNLSISDFRLGKWAFSENLNVSKPVAFFKSDFVE